MLWYRKLFFDDKYFIKEILRIFGKEFPKKIIFSKEISWFLDKRVSQEKYLLNPMSFLENSFLGIKKIFP